MCVLITQLTRERLRKLNKRNALITKSCLGSGDDNVMVAMMMIIMRMVIIIMTMVMLKIEMMIVIKHFSVHDNVGCHRES